MLLVPFIGVLVSGLQILSDLWSTVSSTLFLPCKFINSFKRQHQTISFPTSTFFYYFVKPSGIPAEEALGYMVICMKNLRTKVLLMVPSVIGFRRFLLTVSTNASTRTSVSWATVPYRVRPGIPMTSSFLLPLLSSFKRVPSLSSNSTSITYQRSLHCQLFCSFCAILGLHLSLEFVKQVYTYLNFH